MSRIRCGQLLPRRGFSMVEAVLSMSIVSIVLVAALNTAGAARLTRETMSDQAVGLLLAQDLMAEILQQDYEDADFAPGSFGLGADEVGDGTRKLWEDVDDYDGWSASPPQAKDGTDLPNWTGWTRSVEVDWVPADKLQTTSASDTGVKRIVVTVKRGGAVVATLTAIRTRAAGTPGGDDGLLNLIDDLLGGLL